MEIADAGTAVVGLGGSALGVIILALASLFIRSIFRMDQRDKEYREELRVRDVERRAELSAQRFEWEKEKHQWEADRQQWHDAKDKLQLRLFELEAKVNASEILIRQLTANRGPT